jgi:putative nucleotidyltransferase with HDIG domain
MPIVVYGDSYISAGWVLTLAIIVLFGAPGVVIAAPIEAIAGRYRRHGIDFKSLANGARFICVYYLSAAAYHAWGGETNPADPDLGLVTGGIAATIVCYSLSAGLTTVSVSLRTGQALGAVWEKQRWIAPHYAALGVVGIALSAAYIALGISGVIAFLTPAVMMRLAMKQYVDKTEENVHKLESQNTALKAANIEIRRVSDELRESYDGTLEALVNALDARDQETKGHSIRVSRYMMDIARELGVREGTQQWLDMQRGSLLHDVGKIGVTDNILLKPGKLEPAEWDVMRKHPEIGYQMLKQVTFLQGAAEIILSHHERWDGAGYPRRLRAEDIPLGARIFNVVDTFDSMTSDRPYRKAKSTMDALNEILKYSGSQFDPLVVEAFLDIYDKWVKDWGELHELTAVRAA